MRKNETHGEVFQGRPHKYPEEKERIVTSLEGTSPRENRSSQKACLFFL